VHNAQRQTGKSAESEAQNLVLFKFVQVVPRSFLQVRSTRQHMNAIDWDDDDDDSTDRGISRL